MSFEIIINKKAVNDIQEIIEYYEKQRYGLGDKFEKALFEYIEVLETNPNFRTRYDKIRCLPIKAFPYMIHFSLNKDKKIVRILAV